MERQRDVKAFLKVKAVFERNHILPGHSLTLNNMNPGL